MTTAVERLRQRQGQLQFFKAHIHREPEIVIEAIDREVASNVYAFLVGSHPDTINCPCCGPIGYCYTITEEWALDEIDQGTRFVFDNEYTYAQVTVGEDLWYGR